MINKQDTRPIILLLGANGQVGWELRRSLSVIGQLIALDRHSTLYCGNLEAPNQIAQTILTLKPHVVVNAAAYTAVDKAEQDSDKAYLINATAPLEIAKACQIVNAVMVHYSTDYVFDGTGQHARNESAPCNPINLYGASKLAGEQAIQQNCSRHLIFRTSWVYAQKGSNFAKTMLRLAQEKTSLNVISDQIGAPTGADLIADITAHVVRQTLSLDNNYGLYHLVADGCCSWFEYTQLILSEAQRLGKDLKVKSDQVIPIPSSAYPTAAKRPFNSRLDHELLSNTFNLYLPSWQLGVKRLVQELCD